MRGNWLSGPGFSELEMVFGCKRIGGNNGRVKVPRAHCSYFVEIRQGRSGRDS